MDYIARLVEVHGGRPPIHSLVTTRKKPLEESPKRFSLEDETSRRMGELVEVSNRVDIEQKSKESRKEKRKRSMFI